MRRLDFLYRRELTHRAVSVYIYLADRANKDGQCWPAIPTIARELKLSYRPLRDLRREGLLETEQRYRTKGGQSICSRSNHKRTFRQEGNYALLVEGVTCHGARRKRTTHIKGYMSGMI